MRGISADHIVDDLNNWLERSPEGNVAHELGWAMTQEGPIDQTIYRATAKFRGVTLGEGQGASREVAKGVASKQALTFLNLNGLPRRQA
ncbi:hypothetical protein EI94DRAFT_1797553 [Lactarius quietus]|nr:hypothetical protein EI94DRAFT_1797553 [Lactarius quietus]